jgi:hypothetical protein
MLKKLTLAAVLLSSSWFANATIIQSITGADMTGMVVTVTFGNGVTQSELWSATGPEAGGAFATGWSLTQSGDTIGGLDVVPFGVWTLQSRRHISSLTIEALSAGILFDTEFGDDIVNGSGAGREFTYDDTLTTVNAAFVDNIQDELFGSMTLTGENGWRGDLLLAAGSSFEFMIDTDLIDDEIATAVVSEPATLFFFMSGLLTLVVSRRKVAGK